MEVVLALLLCISLNLRSIAAQGDNSTVISNNVSGPGNLTTPLPQTDVKSTSLTKLSAKDTSTTTTIGQAAGTNPSPRHSQNGTVSGTAPIGDDIPYWVYILIGVGIVILLGAIIGFVKYDRWKSQGTYMVWDSGELQLSPAFISRESEFLIDNATADQGRGSPELQLYEIPLDSLGNPRVCIGTKRVSPRKQTQNHTNRTAKDRKKKDGRVPNQPSTLPRPGKRNIIYSASENGVNNALSEGDINEDQINGNTLTSQGSGSKPRSLALLGNCGSTQLFQNRPLPAAPNKRFSKSLDRLRFLDLLPNAKNSKAATIAIRCRPLPCLPTHPSLVKSMSCGHNLNHMMVNSQLSSPTSPPMKNFDSKENLGASSSRLSHRHSKSLDTLLLLKELDWMSCDIDLHHSYESMHQRENTVDDSPYASVETSNQGSLRSSAHKGSLSPTSQRVSQSPSNGDDWQRNEENPYALVSDEEEARAEDLSRTSSPPNCGRKLPDRTVVQSHSVSSEDAVPYASVRISQIPGLGPSGHGDRDNSVGEVFGDSGSGVEVRALSAQAAQPSRPASTLTYLEILPDNHRSSMISETSSGYARPIDLCPDIVNSNKGGGSHPKPSGHEGAMEAPVEISPSTPDHPENQDTDTCIYVPMGPPVHEGENLNQEPHNLAVTDDRDNGCVVIIDNEPDVTGNAEDSQADSVDKDEAAAVFENVAFVGSLASEDSYL